VERAGVVVVGAGLLGSATAWALAARGVRAIVLEQFSLGHDRGSSHGAIRVFRLSYPDPDYVRMAVAARAAWSRLEAAAGEQFIVPVGGIDAGPGAAGCARALAQCGVAHAWLTAQALGERFPGIRAKEGERFLFQPDAGVCLAGRSVAALQRLAARDGAQIRAGTRVVGIERCRGGVAVRTSGGDLAAATVVVTAGPWAAALLAGLLARPPALTATLQQVRYFEPAAPGLCWPVLLEWPAEGPVWYLVPQAGGAPGVKVAAHAPGRPVDPDGGPFTSIDPALEATAAGYVRARLPGLKPAGLAPETCLYTMTADEDFLLGREGPVVVGGGGSGHAFKFGPLLGEMLASLALGQEPAFPAGRFSLARPALATPPGTRPA
jgi:sarcosine oxidase